MKLPRSSASVSGWNQRDTQKSEAGPRRLARSRSSTCAHVFRGRFAFELFAEDPPVIMSPTVCAALRGGCKQDSGMNEKLEERVHALVRGECSAAEFLQELPALCDAAPDAAWDALSLIDQYHRRGKLSAELFETLRQRIERHALGVPDVALIAEAATNRSSGWQRPAG
ncbi:MAG TPA: hypothetical protein VMF89_13285, partial [Polyangiales bacterium]|nr:hypothetical protein [Polyangiales bacterium]